MPRTEQFEPGTEGVVETGCDYCGEARPCIYVPDPYREKIRGKSLMKSAPNYYCKPCWTDRRDYDGE